MKRSILKFCQFCPVVGGPTYEVISSGVMISFKLVQVSFITIFQRRLFVRYGFQLLAFRLLEFCKYMTYTDLHSEISK